MKVLFLDVDGVLRTLGKSFTTAPVLNQSAFDELVRIVRETRCRIVISSGWRHSTLQGTLSVTSGFGVEVRKMAGCGEIWPAFLDVTGQDEKCRRGVEILKWVAANLHREIEEYAIVDDEHVGSGVDQGKVFLTDPSLGLTTEVADRIIEHLGRWDRASFRGISFPTKPVKIGRDS